MTEYLTPAIHLPIIAFLKEVADGFDCDKDGHEHGNYCRACQANDLLRKQGFKTHHQEMIDDGTIEDFCKCLSLPQKVK